jgi:hypothetical protein
MPSRRRGIFRQVVSGVFALSLLLLSASSVTAMSSDHRPTGHNSSTRIAWEALAPLACPDCSRDPCAGHDTSDGMCCTGAGCMLILLVPETNMFALAAPISVRYCNNVDVGLGLTPEPDVGPPISQG